MNEYNVLNVSLERVPSPYLPNNAPINRWCRTLGRPKQDWVALYSIYNDGKGMGPLFYVLGVPPFCYLDSRSKWVSLAEWNPLSSPDVGVDGEKLGAAMYFCGWEKERAFVVISSRGKKVFTPIPKNHLLHVVERGGVIEMCLDFRLLPRDFFRS